MKIAIVIPDGLSATLFCTGMIRAARATDGCEIAVISDAAEWEAEIERLGAKSISVPMYRFFGPLRDFAYVGALTRIFREEQFDAVVNFSTKPNVYGAIAGWLAGVPTVVGHVVGRGSAFLAANGIGDRMMRATLTVLYRIAARLSDGLWFTNGHDLRYFLDKRIVSEEKALLTRNYLDINGYSGSESRAAAVSRLRAELELTRDDRVVLMIARLIWPKGVREFVEAAVALRQSHPSVWFVLVAPREDGNRDAVPVEYLREHSRESNLVLTCPPIIGPV